MRLGMIADQMAARGYFPYQIGASSSKFADQKKCRAHGIAIKEIKQKRSDGWIRPIVKGEGDLFRRAGVPQCGSV